MARGGGGSGGLVIVGFIFLGVLVAHPIAVILVAAVAILIFWAVAQENKQNKKKPTRSQPAAWKAQAHQPEAQPFQPPRPSSVNKKAPTPKSVSPSSSPHVSPQPVSTNTGFQIPKPVLGSSIGTGSWVPKGESVTVHGLKINGGMLYIGRDTAGTSDPALIDLSRPIDLRAQPNQKLMGYWPSYSNISPEARGAYLNWLASGKCDPKAEIGYVFLYFYGLERRIFVDLVPESLPVAEVQEIVAEVWRLLDIYGGITSFNGYATRFLDILLPFCDYGKLYEKPLPRLPRTAEVPAVVRYALAQATLDGKQISSDFAWTWAITDAEIRLGSYTLDRTLLQRAFAWRYHQSFGNGLLLKPNRSKLALTYTPASAGIQLRTLDLAPPHPDVTLNGEGRERITSIMRQAQEDLAAYDRACRRNPAAKTWAETKLLLPTACWTDDERRAIDALSSSYSRVVTVRMLLGALGMNEPLKREQFKALQSRLSEQGVLLEPDLLGGDKTPKVDDSVVLYRGSPERHAPSHSYYTYALLLELAAAVAHADGTFSENEAGHLKDLVESWTELSPQERARLRAKILLLQKTKVSLTSLAKKVEPLPAEARKTIGEACVALARLDGGILPPEVTVLQKVYKILGLGPLGSKVDRASQAFETAQAAPIPYVDLQLDQQKIDSLRRDSARVGALLAEIFSDENEQPAAAPIVPEVAQEAEASHVFVLGLDSKYSGFVRALVGRPKWTRGDLVDLAADMDLMLDGTLEKVNDAAYARFDEPLTEGIDDVELNQAIVEKLHQ